ncbi:MAG TPA: hypothetical protein PK205_07165 [Promineifilum sp.]|nr:hypothetical protein [Promineifilum sp.]
MTTLHPFPPVMIEKTKVNLWTVGGLIVAICMTVFGWGVTFATMQSELSKANERIERIEQAIGKTGEQVSNITTLQSQISRVAELNAENKLLNDATNKRIDRFIEQFDGKLQNISESVNRLVTRVEVLNATMNLAPSDIPAPRRPTQRRN